MSVWGVSFTVYNLASPPREIIRSPICLCPWYRSWPRTWCGSGTPEVTLSGEGEPLLHPRFFDIVDCFRRARITMQAFTNGSLIDEPMARQIVGERAPYPQCDVLGG